MGGISSSGAPAKVIHTPQTNAGIRDDGLYYASDLREGMSQKYILDFQMNLANFILRRKLGLQEGDIMDYDKFVVKEELRDECDNIMFQLAFRDNINFLEIMLASKKFNSDYKNRILAGELSSEVLNYAMQFVIDYVQGGEFKGAEEDREEIKDAFLNQDDKKKH